MEKSMSDGSKSDFCSKRPHMWSRNKINSCQNTVYFISAPHVRTALCTEIWQCRGYRSLLTLLRLNVLSVVNPAYINFPWSLSGSQ